MATSEFSYLNGSIPGMSLTTEPGNRPWENPPEMATVDEAIAFYAGKILRAREDVMDSMLDIMEAGIPIRNLANIIQTHSVMEGRHSLDVGFLVAPVIEEMLMAVCDINDVKFIRTEAELIEGNYVSRRQTRKAVKEAMEELQNEGLVEESVIEPTAPSTGLMGKPSPVKAPPMAEEQVAPEMPTNNEMGV